MPVHGLIITRLDQLAAFGLVSADLKKSVKRTREALDATDPEDANVPDHPIRLKAADQFFKLAGAYPRPDDDGSASSRPIAVQIILTGGGEARAALQTHGVRLHLGEHNGDRA